MKVLDIKNEKGLLSATIKIEPREFAAALRDAYLDNTDRFVVPGFAAGLAPVGEIEKIYGSEALGDLAIDRAVPDLYRKFLTEQALRIVGRPEVTSIARIPDGGVIFSVRASLYPQVKLGCYKGLKVAQDRENNEEEFKMAVLKKACENMTGEVPEAMAEQKLDSLAAQERLRVNGDAVYHLLADVAYALREGYKAAGASRSAAQVRAEATDIMLQTVSGENSNPSQKFIARQIRSLAERYHTLPDDYDETLDRIFAKRAAQKAQMTPEQLAAEAFTAYLGSIDTDEAKWRQERREEAIESARCDLLLEAVAKAEGLEVTEREISEMVARIAEQCGMEPDEALPQIDLEPVRQQLLRDQACRLLLDSAETDRAAS